MSLRENCRTAITSLMQLKEPSAMQFKEPSAIQFKEPSAMQRVSIKGICAVLIAALLTGLLSSCSSMIASTRSDPIQEDYTKRTPGAVVDDNFIETKSAVNLKKVDSRFSDAQINVNSYNGVVLLTGIVPEGNLRDLATTTVQKIRKVRRVHNELYEAPPRGFAARMADSWLNRRINTKLMFDRDIPSSRYRVVVHNGTAYLMGLATQETADQVVTAVKEVRGVQKIVRVFEYIDVYEPAVN